MQGFGSCVKDISATGTLDMDVNKARGKYPAFRVEYFITADTGLVWTDVRDKTVFDENGCVRLSLRRIEQSTIRYEKLL